MLTMNDSIEKNDFIQGLEKRMGHPHDNRKTMAVLHSALGAFSEVFGADDVRLVEEELGLPSGFNAIVCAGCEQQDLRSGHCMLPDDPDIRLAMGCLLELYVTVAHREMTNMNRTSLHNQRAAPVLRGPVSRDLGFDRLGSTSFTDN